MALQTYIAEGFTEDCEELIHTLTDKFQKVDWHKFCVYWKEMQFDILFYGRQSGPELVEFTEELLEMARLYIVTETDNFEDQVIGLFIAYAITIIQPYKNLCAMRLVPKDVTAFIKIEAEARKDNRTDVLMILAKMYIHGKMQFHASVRERAMDISIRKYFDNSTQVPVSIARRWHGRLDRHRINALEDIAQTETEYMELKMKAKLAAEAVFPGTDVKVDIFKPEAKHMAESLRKLTLSAKNPAKDEGNDESYATLIKRKAMKKAVDPMKHLHGLADRKKAEEPKVTSKRLKAKTKQKHKCSNSSPQEYTNEPVLGLSLPSLDDPSDRKKKHEGTPEPRFRGFTAEEIQLSDYTEKIKPHQSSNATVPVPAKTYSTTKTNIVRSPVYNGCKRKNSHNEPETTKKKRKLKNKFNKKIKLNDFNTDGSDTAISDEDLAEAVKPTSSNAECVGKELTIQSKGVLKHFVEFELSDIVIRTEKDAPPEKDIEIEYIDNYKGTNALYEEICEVSDEEDVKNENEVTNGNVTSLNNNDKVSTGCDAFADAHDDDITEVFQVVTEDTKRTKVKKTRRAKHKEKFLDKSFPSIDDDEVNETVKKILSKDYIKRNTERRRLKQPNLRSKLKKMGLLPVADFDD